MTGSNAFYERVKERFRAADPNWDRRAAEHEWHLDIAQQIYDLREAAGLTEEQLAEKAGVTADDIDAIEHCGWEEGTFDKLVKTLAVFNKQVEIRILDPERQPVAA